jgi:hypothetical protein
MKLLLSAPDLVLHDNVAIVFDSACLPLALGAGRHRYVLQPSNWRTEADAHRNGYGDSCIRCIPSEILCGSGGSSQLRSWRFRCHLYRPDVSRRESVASCLCSGGRV